MNDKTQVQTTTDPNAPATTGRDEARNDDRAMLPRVDVLEDDSGITLLADLPGVPRDKLGLRIDIDTLTIEGDVALPLPQEMTPSHAEVQLAHYRRAFTLSKELDAEKISAEFAHGVLRVRIPKAEHAQPRKIKVAVA
jgi:HSP20 family protein